MMSWVLLLGCLWDERRVDDLRRHPTGASISADQTGNARNESHSCLCQLGVGERYIGCGHDSVSGSKGCTAALLAGETVWRRFQCEERPALNGGDGCRGEGAILSIRKRPLQRERLRWTPLNPQHPGELSPD